MRATRWVFLFPLLTSWPSRLFSRAFTSDVFQKLLWPALTPSASCSSQPLLVCWASASCLAPLCHSTRSQQAAHQHECNASVGLCWDALNAQPCRDLCVFLKRKRIFRRGETWEPGVGAWMGAPSAAIPTAWLRAPCRSQLDPNSAFPSLHPTAVRFCAQGDTRPWTSPRELGKEEGRAWGRGWHSSPCDGRTINGK